MNGSSRRKGYEGQREVALALRKFYRSPSCFYQRSLGQKGPPDLVIPHPLWRWTLIEIKRVGEAKKLRLHYWWRVLVKAARAAKEKPILMFRLDGNKRWKCLISTEDALRLARASRLLAPMTSFYPERFTCLELIDLLNLLRWTRISD